MSSLWLNAWTFILSNTTSGEGERFRFNGSKYFAGMFLVNFARLEQKDVKRT